MDPGTVLAGRYRVQHRLRRSANGDVFVAEHLATRSAVEIKVGRDRAVDGGRLSEVRDTTHARHLARFRREVRAASLFESGHVQRAIGVDTDPSHGPILILEHLPGESLLDRLKRQGPLPFAEAHPIFAEMWLALSTVHAAGIVHRDLRPSNVHLGQGYDGSPRLKLRDLDLCLIDGDDTDAASAGEALGTFSFMPPEQIGRGRTVDHRVDVYGATTVIFQTLTGKLPYEARNILVMVEMKTKVAARKLAEAAPGPFDPRLEAFVARGLERDPSLRFPSAGEALDAWRSLTKL